MLRHLARIAEVVEDTQAAVHFYRDVLGLEVEVISEGYADVTVPGVLHFGIWSRAEAAKATFGRTEYAYRVPLGFSIGFEVDDVRASAEHVGNSGIGIAQPAKTEPWGQRTARFFTTSGALCEVAETPWARHITRQMSAE